MCPRGEHGLWRELCELMCTKSAGDTNPIVLSHCLWFTIVVDTPSSFSELGVSQKVIELVKLRDLEEG